MSYTYKFKFSDIGDGRTKTNPYALSKALHWAWLGSKSGIRPTIDTVDDIRSQKQKYRNYSIDRLSTKLQRYGNSGGYIRQLVNEKSKAIFDTKKPAMDGNVGKYITIELEAVIKTYTYDSLMMVLGSDGYFRKNLTVKDDSSIRDKDSNEHCENDDCDPCECYEKYTVGKEFVLTVKQGEYEPIKKLTDILSKYDATVNTSCGYHVHFDFRHADVKGMYKKAARIGRAVGALKTMLPKERRVNDFCSVPINTLRKGDRYTFVNTKSYAKYKTLEIRGHSGTLNYNKIVNWIEILWAMLTIKRATKETLTTMDEVIFEYRLGHMKEYITERVAKFNKNEQAVESDSESVFNMDQEQVIDISA